MENKIFEYVPSFSLTPSRLSLFSRKTTIEGYKSSNVLSNFKKDENGKIKRFHNFSISEQARKSLQLKINWLYFMAKSRYKKSLSGKEIHNFKLNFITLTLPSKQVHSTSEITNKAFNQFLVEIRAIYGIENYVWRLEFQKNRNIHYHIVTDSYTDFDIVRKIWNRCIGKLGYVAEYAKKHQMMSLNDYVGAYSQNGKVAFDVLKKRYFFGKALNWQMPNSVDVKSVSNGKAINLYISKYFSKKENKQNECNPLDNESNSQGLRLWFCSRSLSKLKTVSDYVEATGRDIIFIISNAKNVFKVIHEYCTSYFYSFSDIWNDGKSIVHKALYNYALLQSYKPSQ